MGKPLPSPTSDQAFQDVRQSSKYAWWRQLFGSANPCLQPSPRWSWMSPRRRLSRSQFPEEKKKISSTWLLEQKFSPSTLRIYIHFKIVFPPQYEGDTSPSLEINKNLIHVYPFWISFFAPFCNYFALITSVSHKFVVFPFFHFSPFNIFPLNDIGRYPPPTNPSTLILKLFNPIYLPNLTCNTASTLIFQQALSIPNPPSHHSSPKTRGWTTSCHQPDAWDCPNHL